MNSRHRLLLAFGSLALLAVTAGCTGGIFGPGEISDEKLNQSASYDWNTSSDVTINISGDQYQAVYNVSNRTQLGVYEFESLGGKRPVEIAAVQFQYPNGTVVGAEKIEVEKKDSRTIVHTPAKNGKLAYSAPHRGKSFSMPAYVEGSYEVVLPRGMRVDNFLLSHVRPDDYQTTDPPERVHITWDDVSAKSINVQYYLARDLTILAGIVGVGVLLALLGLGYFRLQIRELERKREEMGLNVDTSGDEFDDGPPPGMG
ncbi:DUF5803 family protein [Halorussus halophilus]|uniref:DUF5803 family protein n=1 Tax=Halorussus halophilus TaxID=2650975 RepID=UPI00130139E8|nr:DUF5803 family protein [Halorussus halophilus]